MSALDHGPFVEADALHGSGSLAARLGRLRAQTWPRPPPLAGSAFAELLRRAQRSGVAIDERASGPTAVRVAATALRQGLRRLGLSGLEADVPGATRLRVTSADHLDRLADDDADGSVAPVVIGLVSTSHLDAALAQLARFACVGATDPVLVRLLLAQGVEARLWSPVEAMEGEVEEGIDDPLLAGLPRVARMRRPDVDVWSERPLDVVSLGEEGGERSALLGRSAGMLSRHACVIVHRRHLWRLADEPLLAEAAARFVFRRAKVVLNIHAGEFSALDWSLGTLDAMALGALVVSTPCHPHPFLAKDVHYLEETPDRIPRLVEWLLETPAGARAAETLRAAAMTTLAAEARPARMTADLLAAALAAAEARA